MNYQKQLLLFFTFLIVFQLKAQKATIQGRVKDLLTNQPIENVTVYLGTLNINTETDENGQYQISIPPNQPFQLLFSRLDYQLKTMDFSALRAGELKEVSVGLKPIISNLNIVISESRIEQTGIIRESVKELVRLPNNTSNLEGLFSGIALGVNTGIGGELSAQYNVRGGNFDENLVYVNDFEINRPQLIRSSVREGLTFANPDLIQTFTFSSGGFQANYGDKLSSVLDIQYKKPDSTAASISLGLLGGSAHLEGKQLVGKKKKTLRYLFGVRYKNTNQLLNSLDTKDATKANFWDIQGYFSYEINPQLELSFIKNTNNSNYQFNPTESKTRAGGSKTDILELSSNFMGSETTYYKNEMGGMALNYLPTNTNNPSYFKILFSAYTSEENEASDILALYTLERIDTRLTSPTVGEAIEKVGEGGQYNYIENELTTDILSLEHKGGIDFSKGATQKVNYVTSFLQWGIKYQYELVKDSLFEMERIGTESYTTPVAITSIPLSSSLNSQTTLSSNRFSGFVQNTYSANLTSGKTIKLTTGIRAMYWDLNASFFVTPRVQLLIDNGKHITYKLATGLYYQSPFYRELRNERGLINEAVDPQKSWQIVGGLTYDFNTKRNAKQKFRFIAEAYYKKLWDLVTYDLKDVRIQYSGENDAKGYAMGLDLRLNGSFVPNTESWINVSFLKTRESLEGVEHKDAITGASIKSVPRPNDRFMNISVFFQDHFPRFKRLETYLNFNIGTGLPYGLGENRVVRNNLRYQTNHQANVGFSFSLWNRAWLNEKPKHWLRFSQNAWLSLDLINFLNIRNVATNRVIQTPDRQYILPNYLTSRTFNLRCRIEL